MADPSGMGAGKTKPIVAPIGLGQPLLAKAEVYDAAARTFVPVGDRNTPRLLHTATLLNNGRVLIAGGASLPGFPLMPVHSAELYTPRSSSPPPVLLSVSRDGQGAILHAGTDRVASAAVPATASKALEIYFTGLTEGSVIPPQVTIGGRMPGGVPPGRAVAVRMNYLGRWSNQVTISVQ